MARGGGVRSLPFPSPPSMVIRLRPCTRSRTSLLSSIPPLPCLFDAVVHMNESALYSPPRKRGSQQIRMQLTLHATRPTPHVLAPRFWCNVWPMRMRHTCCSVPALYRRQQATHLILASLRFLIGAPSSNNLEHRLLYRI